MSKALILITGRTLSQGKTKERKFNEDYAKSASICEMDRTDMEALGINEGSNVEVETAHGKVILKAIASKDAHPGSIFVPMGPWASVIVDPNTQGSGMPTLKGILAMVRPTSKPLTSLTDLLKEASRKEVGFPTHSNLKVQRSIERIVSNALCPFCGCLCDDVEAVIKGSKIVEARNVCALGRTKLLNHDLDRPVKPTIRRNGKLVKTNVEEAVDVAADILVNAKYPILYGWSSTSNEAMRLGVELAELVGGIVDNTAVICHGPTYLGVHQTGLVTATLGQIKHSADLVVYWGCNPLNAHVRHAARYSASAVGRFVKGRKERKVIVVDVKPTLTSKVADLFVKVDHNADYELLTALRMALRGLDIEAPSVAGVDRKVVEELADSLASAKFGVLFFGVGLTMSAGKNRNIEEAIKLVQDLNEWTKFVLMPMRGHFNVTGTNAVMAWLTGFPLSIDFSGGYPFYDPGITSTTDALERREVDAALVIASDPVSHFPRKFVEWLSSIPLVVIDPRWTPTASVSDVFIPSAFVGIECEGTLYRMDLVPLRAKKLVNPPEGVLSDQEILARLIGKVKGRMGVTTA